MDDVADVGRGQVHAELGREAVLGPDEERVVGLLVELLLAEGEEPGLALEGRRRARWRRRAAGRRGPCWRGRTARPRRRRGRASTSGRRKLSMSRMAATASSGDSERRVRAAAAGEPAHRVGVASRGTSPTSRAEKSSSAEGAVLHLGPRAARGVSRATFSKRAHSPSRSRLSSKSATRGSVLQ